MITMIVSQTRPDVSIPFFQLTTPEELAAWDQHCSETYENKLTKSFFENGFTRTTTTTCPDKETADAYLADPKTIAYRAARDAYNESNGISLTFTVTES